MKDYQKRLVEEYTQLAERVNKLGEMLKKYKEGTLDFELNCPFSLLEKQHELMMAYLIVLNQRLLIENIKTEK